MHVELIISWRQNLNKILNNRVTDQVCVEVEDEFQ